MVCFFLSYWIFFFLSIFRMRFTVSCTMVCMDFGVHVQAQNLYIYILYIVYKRSQSVEGQKV